MKREGTTRPVIIVNVGLVRYLYSLGGLGACPQEILKSNLSTVDVPVDTGTENLNCIICMPISMPGNVAEITIFYSSYAITS